MSHNNKQKSNYAFYDIEELQAIPVRSIADAYGLRPTKNKHMFYAPSSGEKDGSLYLYETNGQNRFWDFGRNVGGGPIEFVMYINNMEWKDAVQELGQMFCIQPQNNENKEFSWELSDRQWSKIGISGDLATKNFDFNFDIPNAVKRNEAIAKKYNMSMNELRKKNPGVYKKVLQNRAFSYMYACQQQYFHALDNEFFSMKLGGFTAFDKITSYGRYEVQKIVDEIQKSEYILKQALKGTDLKFDFYTFDIDADFQKIVSGEMSLEVGTVSLYDVKWNAKERNHPLKEMEIGLSTFEEIQKMNFTFPYGAVQTKDTVLITAQEEYISIFENMEQLLLFGLELDSLDKSALQDKISEAQERTGSEDKPHVGKKPER